ncbi:MFR1L regulator, partial [Polypterus senegalus]
MPEEPWPSALPPHPEALGGKKTRDTRVRSRYFRHTGECQQKIIGRHLEHIRVIPIWQNKPHGSARSVVRRIGSTLPLKPCQRACFEALPGLPPLPETDYPMVPTLADIAWIAADEEETYARVRKIGLPFPIVLWEVSSDMNIRPPAMHCSSAPLTPDLLSPDDTSMTFSVAPFEPSIQSGASFVISDITEEVAELEFDPPQFAMNTSTTFEMDQPSLDCEEKDDDTVSLSKSTSYADVMDILKDMNRRKLSKDRFLRGCSSPHDEDSASLISEALRKKFTLKDDDLATKNN